MERMRRNVPNCAEIEKTTNQTYTQLCTEHTENRRNEITRKIIATQSSIEKEEEESQQ